MNTDEATGQAGDLLEPEVREPVYIYKPPQNSGVSDEVTLKLGAEPLLLGSGYVRLAGVVSGRKPRALLEAGGRGLGVEIGDEFSGYMVAAIKADNVLLARGVRAAAVERTPGANRGKIIPRTTFYDAAVLDVIRLLAQRADLDLIITGDQTGAQNKRTSLRLRNTSAEQAIRFVLRSNGIVHEEKDKTLLVYLSPQPQLTLPEDGAVKTIDLKYLSAEKAIVLLSKLAPAVRTGAGNRAGSLVLCGRDSQVEAAAALVKTVDKPAPQILIESRVLEISELDSLRLGFSFNQGGGTFQCLPAEDLETSLNALIGEGRAEVVARPRIATLDDHTAVINIGSRIPYAVPVSGSSSSVQWAVQYIDAGVRLEITPRLGEEGYITAAIQPEVSSVAQWKMTAAGEFPVITTRNAGATVRVKDGETILVGGLLSTSDRENTAKLPVLGYLPIVGGLFQNRTVEKEKTEIVFLITPHII